VTKLTSNGKCDGLTFGAYNVENLAPTSSHMSAIAAHIVTYLKSPDVMFLQEVQDNNGATNDAVVSANLTLSTLVSAIAAAGGPTYAFANADPVDDKDGGAPGGNIQVAYLYKPSLVRLYKPNAGNSTSATAVLPGPVLKYNPGRIDPLNEAWTASRKPLVAQWEVIAQNGKASSKFFTIDVHFGSKGGSSSIQGDARPPVNGGVDDRLAQATLTAEFVQSIMAQDKNARIITAAFVQPITTYKSISKLEDLDAVAGIQETERYTYLFDMSSQQLDHMFVSKSISNKGAKYEHVHINTWVEFAAQISDHDPSVAKLNVCA
jgi:predicted extracellular nuclease